MWNAVKACGGNKSPGPGSFTFGFLKRFWTIIKEDLMAALGWFWQEECINQGSNSSFLTLIPKVANPEGHGEFRPISLIGGYYKIVAKILV